MEGFGKKNKIRFLGRRMRCAVGYLSFLLMTACRGEAPPPPPEPPSLR